MKCPYCGAENEDDAYVCTSCGMPLKRSHPHYEDEDHSENEDDFFESDMYDDPKETQSDSEDDSIGDETIAADEDTIFYQKENIDDTDEEEPRNESFSFDEEDDDEDEGPFEDVIPQESKLDSLKNKFKSLKKEKAEPEYEDEEDEEEPVHRAENRVKSFFNDEDEEDYETDQAREDNLEDVYDEEERRPRRKSSIRIIPFKFLILILVVAAVVGGILRMRNKSANNTSTTTKTTTTAVKPVIASVKASSTLRETGYDHSADLMIDGDLTTAWQEGVTGDGIGQYATFTLKNKASVKSCSIANGYDKSSYLYTRNNRVKEATFTFDDGTSETHTLKDQYNTYSKITFKKTHKTKTIKITITSIYRGTYYHDTCISEVKFA